MKNERVLKVLLMIIPLILSLVLMSCKSNDISQESSESEEVIAEAAEDLESEEEKTEGSNGEEVETEEVIEEAEEMEKEEYDGLCRNSYFPVRPDFLWTYFVKYPNETYEFTSSFYEITDSSFTEKIESSVFNADIKWLCFPDGLVQSEYSALILEEDDQGIELTTESFDGITLPPPEKWVIGYKWDTVYTVRTTIIVEDERMTFTGDILIKNEIVSIESVTVPAGTFPESVKIDMDKNMNISADIGGKSMSFNAHTDISSWYVEETGLVKQVSKATCGTTTVELLSIEEKDEEEGVTEEEISGQKIIFASDRDGNFEIYVMNIDGSNQTRLTNNSALDSSPAWSPDGSKIAFFTDRDGNEEIYIMNTDGSGQAKLTDNQSLDAFPDWSPDGSKIVFESNRDGNLEIYVMNADGTGQVNLTNSSADDTRPDWSSDGNKIVFSSLRGGNSEIYVMDADGTGQVNLTNNPLDDSHPDWSPDGSKVVFESNRDGGNLEIYVMNADGTGQIRLTDNQDFDGMPDWSPDGSKIVFATLRDKNYKIYVMNADDTGQIRLTDNQHLYDVYPDW